jgi:hypothetical protein
MRSLLLLASLVTVALPAPVPSQDHPLGVFHTMEGEWEGEAWMLRPEGRITVTQREWVMMEAGGKAAAVRGIGVLCQGDREVVVHHAFAVIHQNRERTGLMMRAITAEGHWLDPEIVGTAKGYTWKMRDERIGDIKYEMTVDDQGRWIENGFFSRDGGQTWNQFLGMTLTRKTK